MRKNCLLLTDASEFIPSVVWSGLKEVLCMEYKNKKGVKSFGITSGKITGFFGMFDILGYRSLIENNTLDSLIEIFNEFIMDLDQKAVTLMHQDEHQVTAITPTKTLIFSDTIILYQTMSESMLDFSPSFLTKACVLLRLGFEHGVPLRGAISFGEFFVHERSYLGKPIVDAFEAEKNQQWLGVILTASAEQKYQDYKKERQSSKNITWRGINLNPADIISPFSPDIVVDTNIPIKKESQTQKIKGYSLRWDDYIVDFAQMHGIKDLNASLSKESIESRVKESFSAHGKKIDSDDVKQKIENTVDFLEEMRDRPLEDVRLVYR